ncbi:MAG: sigma-54 dependent transcriptional regulator, partial [Thermodesulfovibrionales bacterium]|nr:sigma-54 dependent transcriptional regulator [Thermodesulfovibrionales bacterium]
MQTVLLVEDNKDLRENIKWALKSFYNVIEADSKVSCIEEFKKYRPAVVCLDLGLDNKDDCGLSIIDELLAIDRFTKILIITGSTNISYGLESIKRGAFDYLNKPVPIEEIKSAIERAIRISVLERASVASSSSSAITPMGLQINNATFMIGTSKNMQEIFEHIKKLAELDVNVLIIGESGTGKELCARAIHYLGPRKTANFVPINCGAIPENLIESELFGYVKGAFTGATADKEGLIESADGGTLLLDEIGEMPKNLQVRLLRFLEDQKVQRIGSTIFKKVNVRVIAATNRKDIIKQNDDSAGLREDLYYRLSEFQIDLPPLRERGEDVILIAEAIIENFRRKFNRARLALSPRAKSALFSYSWPGNVRELENKLSRAAITCKNDLIEPEDLQLSAPTGSPENIFVCKPYEEAKNAFDKEYLISLLKQTKGNVLEASNISGISRPTIYNM